MSESYQADSRISLDDVHYAPLGPGERDLQIIGDVHGRHMLELACGAAQNSIALAKWGARVTALDFSTLQLAKARELVAQENVEVGLVRGDMERLGMFRGGLFDVVLSSFGWEFVPDLEACFSECHRVLKDDGLLIVCTVHPLTAFEWDSEEEALIVTDYFNPPVEVWEEPSVPGQTPGRFDKLIDSTISLEPRALTFFHTFEEMFSLLTSAGFAVERVVEPYPYQVEAMSEEERKAIPYGGPYWEGQYERFSRVPFSIVYRARKR